MAEHSREPAAGDGERREPLLWFTRAGAAYLVTDPRALAPLGTPPEGCGAARGQQLRRLADDLLQSGLAEPAFTDPFPPSR